MEIKTKNIVLSGLLLALGIIIPSIFHFTGINGSIFSPMHITVLLSGFILGPILGLIIGILTPILNFLILGMPPIFILWIMIVELGIYGLASGILYKKIKLSIYPSLICSMIIGRLGSGIWSFILVNLLGLKVQSPILFLKGATIGAIPAIILQIILIPILVKIYER
ncbi:ECF transporter S component [Clostridium sp. D2Q-14]|uniref:ECF transporter S component n=1 Tax=Anaeromonas gelatinilytica TaxID=2683194 RepID=UPI00193C618D|nr:ECF transporter S component [Anaeromonas gelatinilytica]MBS4535875.1 ECF transporter S component [Anaeromonas gelatinilytica]